MEREIKVLLVEDDPDWIALIGRVLAEAFSGAESFELASADTLARGLELLAARDFDVVLLDLLLPDSTGLATLDAARARAPGVPIVVMTGLSEEETALEALARGAQDFLVKPSLDPKVVRRAIGYAVERSRLMGQLENLVENAADAMVVVDSEGLVRYANPAAEALFGRRKEAMLGRPFGYPVSPGTTAELKIAEEGGGHRLAQMRVSEVQWRKYKACLASIRDITELRKYERIKAEIAERRKVERYKDQLIGTVSHELRSPLSVIETAIFNLVDGLAGPLTEQQSLMLSIARNNVERLTRIIHNLLDLSRLESGRTAARRQPVDLAALLEQAAQEARLKEGSGGLRISIEAPNGLPRAYADPDMLVQVVTNLLENARRFARSSVILRAAALPRGAGRARPEVVVSVVDDGPGIPEDKMLTLFMKFAQISRPAVGGYRGTGLGLAICHDIAKLNDGRIWAESAAGRGASFHFALPQYTQEAHHVTQ